MRPSSRLRALRTALGTVLGAVALGGCAAEEGPRDALAAVQSAVEARDGALALGLIDIESRGFYAQRVREWRARIARGEAPELVLEDAGVPAAEVTSGTEQDAAGAYFLRYATVAVEEQWLRDAHVVEEVEESMPADVSPQTHLVLESPSGEQRRVWFVREGGRWVYDHFRTSLVERQ